MASLRDALDPLEPDATKRVLTWAADRFAVDLSPADSDSAPTDDGNQGGEDQQPDPQQFDDFADLYYKADPSTHQERVLVGGYWFQVVQGANELTSRAINKELKNVGWKVPNITRAFRRLEQRKDPSLAMQVRKTGSSQQARKIYRLTKPGVQYVEQMLGKG